jgi:hypothetical protein
MGFLQEGLLALFPLLAALLVAPAAGLTWAHHGVPLTGELVLTDVHAIYVPGSESVVGWAAGEGGVLLKLDHLPAANRTGAWTVALDTSFPLYWYGVHAFDEDSVLLSGFLDGSGQAYGVITFSEDGGETWSNDTVIDPVNWGGGPIQFDLSGQQGLMGSTSGDVMWRTTSGGKTWADWAEVHPDTGNWHTGDYVFDGNGFAMIAGSSHCNSSDFGGEWQCTAAEDQSSMDGGIACSDASGSPTALCLTGGGEISPAVAGWVHMSVTGGATWNTTRALDAAFPIRSVLAIVPAAGGMPVLVAAGGNFYSNVGGIYSSADGGLTWTLDLDLGQEVKACRALPLPSLSVTRIYCVSSSATGGSIVSTDI